MKKRILFLIIIFSFSIISGCSDFNEKEYIEEVLGYLSDKDAETLKSMFCPIIIDIKNIDEQIQEALGFIEGEIISYNSPQGGSGKEWKSGKIVRYDISPYIENVETSTGKIYNIRFYSHIVNDESKDKIGISEITIINESGDECKVGDYYLVNPEWR